MDPAWKREMEKLGDRIGDVVLVQLSVKKKKKKPRLQTQGNQTVVSKVFDLMSERNDSQRKSHFFSPGNSEGGTQQRSTASP